MTGTPRYAIYYMPVATSALWRFGCRVIGYDACGAEPPPPFDQLGDAAAAGVFAEPARYGFHATLKAPFELAAGKTESHLLAAAAEFAGRQPQLPLGLLKIAPLDRFIALIPAAPPDALETFAAECVREFDDFRAALSAADRERRLQSPMTATQRAYLDAWGYPYVFEEFRFHMTLCGPLTPDLLAPLTTMLGKLYASIDHPVALDGLAVFKQPERTAPFHVLQRLAFARA